MVITITPSTSGDEADHPGSSKDDLPEPTTPFASRLKEEEPCAEPPPTAPIFLEPGSKPAGSPVMYDEPSPGTGKATGASPVMYERNAQNEKVWEKFGQKKGGLHMTSWKPRSSQDVRQ